MTNFEAKAYKKLHNLVDCTLYRVLNKIKNSIDYHSDKPEQLLQDLQEIDNKARWDYNGIQSKEDAAVIKALEECLKQD